MGAVEGTLVDVRRGELVSASIEWEGDQLTRIRRIPGDVPTFILPGFIDAHIHIESSLLCPSRFAEAVLPHGTTAIIADPHEIANVLGLAGIEYLRLDAQQSPLRFYLTAPSSVPSTPFETAGASLGVDEVERLLELDDVVGLGEVMNYVGLLGWETDPLAKVKIARRLGKRIDGHCPQLSGRDLRAYASFGIETDHECTSSAEAFEKHRAGIKIMVRQGSASRNLRDLLEFAKEQQFMLVSDDKDPRDLAHGHLDQALREAIDAGLDPIHAVRAVTLNPAEHYRLPLGVLEPGRKADFVVVENLRNFRVREVWVGGRQVAERGQRKFTTHPHPLLREFVTRPITAEDFLLPAEGTRVGVRAIGIRPNSLVTDEHLAEAPVHEGMAAADAEADLLHVAVVNRYRPQPPSRAFVHGIGLRSGALATSVAHDAHNFLVVGAEPAQMIRALQAIGRHGGLAVAEAERLTTLDLPVAGLMTTEAVTTVQSKLADLVAHARALGAVAENPFTVLSFLSLLVIPKLKISDRGLFDVENRRFVRPLLVGDEGPAEKPYLAPAPSVA